MPSQRSAALTSTATASHTPNEPAGPVVDRRLLVLYDEQVCGGVRAWTIPAHVGTHELTGLLDAVEAGQAARRAA